MASGQTHQNLDERRKWYRVMDAPLRVPTIIVIRRDTQRGVRLNEVVYDAFGLTAGERGLIEEATQYPYGEV